MTPEAWIALVAICTTVILAMLGASFVLWGKLTTVENELRSIGKWLQSIADGKGPVCMEHSTQIREICRRLGVLEK